MVCVNCAAALIFLVVSPYAAEDSGSLHYDYFISPCIIL